MAKYKITLCGMYRKHRFYPVGSEVELPDDLQPPKGAEPLDDAARKWTDAHAAEQMRRTADSLRAKADELEKRAAAKRGPSIPSAPGPQEPSKAAPGTVHGKR